MIPALEIFRLDRSWILMICIFYKYYFVKNFYVRWIKIYLIVKAYLQDYSISVNLYVDFDKIQIY